MTRWITVGHVIHVYIIVNVLTHVHSRLQSTSINYCSRPPPMLTLASYRGYSLTELQDKAQAEGQHMFSELDFVTHTQFSCNFLFWSRVNAPGFFLSDQKSKKDEDLVGFSLALVGDTKVRIKCTVLAPTLPRSLFLQVVCFYVIMCEMLIFCNSVWLLCSLMKQ